jgi:hypothetical protein
MQILQRFDASSRDATHNDGLWLDATHRVNVLRDEEGNTLSYDVAVIVVTPENEAWVNSLVSRGNYRIIERLTPSPLVAPIASQASKAIASMPWHLLDVLTASKRRFLPVRVFANLPTK